MQQRRYRTGFTLIELLVVVGIIAVLISIIVPTVGRAKEAANRSACASQLRQLADATRSLAVDNDGRFLLTNYGLNAKDTYAASYPAATNSPNVTSDHIHWIPTHLRNLYQKKAAIDFTTYKCPSMPQEWIRVQATRTRISYFLLAGRNGPSFKPLNGRLLTFPMKVSDPATLVLAADIIEKGTQTQAGGTNTVGAQAPHGNHGFVSSTDEVNPKELGSTGGNFAYLDGSVQWEHQDSLVPYHSHVGPASPKEGWFPEGLTR